MAFIAGDVAEMSVIGTADSQAVVNVLHYFARAGDPVDAGLSAAALNIAMRAMWRASILGLLANSYSVSMYRCRIIRGVGLATPPPPELVPGDLIYDSGDDLPGDATDIGAKVGDYLPTFNAVTVQKRTAGIGRRFRGAVRMAPVIEGDTVGNFITGAFQTAVLGAWNTDGRDITSGATVLRLGVFREFSYRRQLVGPTGPPQGFISEVTTFVVNLYLGSQVSRKRRAIAPG